MITAVTDEYHKRQYWQACLGVPGLGAFLACRLQRYGHAPLAGYRFFTCGRGSTAALMVCGGTAYATPGFDESELGSLLGFMGVHTLFAVGPYEAPQGFAVRSSLALVQASAAATLPALPAEVTVEFSPALWQVARLALQGQPDADEQAAENLYSELCTGRAHGDGMAVAVHAQGELAAAALAPALWQHTAAIVGVFTQPQVRGQGLGSLAVNSLVHALAQKGCDAYLWCEEAVLPFYRANGFIQIGEIKQFIHKG